MARDSAEAGAGGGRRASLSDVVSMIVRDGLPVFGVFFLGWQAFSVVFLYWLDGVFSLLAIIVPATLMIDREDPKLLAKYRGARKALLVGIILFFACLLVLVMMAIPGAMIWGQASKHGLDPLGILAGSRSTLLFAGIMGIAAAASATVARLRGIPSGDRLTTQERGNMVFHRAVLAGILASIAIGGWTLKLFTLVIAVLFAYSELYPERYLRMLGRRIAKP